MNQRVDHDRSTQIAPAATVLLARAVQFSPLQSIVMLLLLLPLLLASFLRPTTPAAPDCSPKACGGLTVSYPFWLHESGSEQPCGSPSFELRCNGGRAFLAHSMFGLYQVVRVFNDNSSFVVVDNYLPLNDGCPAPAFDIARGIGLGPFVISKRNRELVVLRNCTEQLQATPPQGFLRTPCVNDSSFFRLGEEYGSRGGRLPSACSLTIVPFLGFPGRDDGYVASMRQGFLLEWTVASDVRPRCIASGGQRGYASGGAGFSCSCSDGPHLESCATCENLIVKYPFWLGVPNTDPSPSSANFSCGPPPFEVWCSNDGSVASLRSSAIHVLRIDYGSSSFVPSHSRVADGPDGVCRTDFNMSPIITLSPFSISNRALCFLYNCNCNGTGQPPSGDEEYVNVTSDCGKPILAVLGGRYDRD